MSNFFKTLYTEIFTLKVDLRIFRHFTHMKLLRKRNFDIIIAKPSVIYLLNAGLQAGLTSHYEW